MSTSINVYADSIEFDGQTATLRGIDVAEVVGEFAPDDVLDALDFDVVGAYFLERRSEDEE